MFSSAQSLSHVQLFATQWIAAHQASLSITNSQSSLKLMSIESVMPSSLVVPFSSCPQSLPASGSFSMSQLFSWGGQSIGVSALASVLPMNTQDWSPSEWTGWTSLQSKGLSRVLSNTTVQKHQFFSTQLSSQSNSHIHTWPLEKDVYINYNNSHRSWKHLEILLCEMESMKAVLEAPKMEQNYTGIYPAAASAAKSLQSCPTLCDPRDSSPPGSPIPGILQARTLEWVATSFSNTGKWKWSRPVVSDS